MHDIYPVTIISDRYNGAYSGAKWLAYNRYAEDIPSEISDGDIECHQYWLEQKYTKYPALVGKGDTPDKALQDLEKNCIEYRNAGFRDND